MRAVIDVAIQNGEAPAFSAYKKGAKTARSAKSAAKRKTKMDKVGSVGCSFHCEIFPVGPMQRLTFHVSNLGCGVRTSSLLMQAVHVEAIVLCTGYYQTIASLSSV